MSHLIIEQGKEVGREVTVPPAGMKFGRSPANDLVLEDEAAMLFHGRFFFKSDGTLWVTDFGAGEKTTVGGIPIDEYALKAGDLVEVGDTAFRIINNQLDASGGSAAARHGDGEIDLGFKGGKGAGPGRQAGSSGPSKSTLLPRLMQVGVILLVLVVLLIVVPSLVELSKDGTKTVKQRQLLTLSYERVQANRQNIFRYALELDEGGRFSIIIDDLKNNRHVQKSMQLSKTMLLQLSNSIEEAGFFRVDSDYAGAAEGQYDLYDIAVQRNRRSHHIKVLNRNPPRGIKRTVAAIEDFALSELAIPFTMFKDNFELMHYNTGIWASRSSTTRRRCSTSKPSSPSRLYMPRRNADWALPKSSGTSATRTICSTSSARWPCGIGWRPASTCASSLNSFPSDPTTGMEL